MALSGQGGYAALADASVPESGVDGADVAAGEGLANDAVAE